MALPKPEIQVFGYPICHELFWKKFTIKKTPKIMTSFYIFCRDFNHPVTQQTNEDFQFPDSDYEEEGVKDGIKMFSGTIFKFCPIFVQK